MTLETGGAGVPDKLATQSLRNESGRGTALTSLRVEEQGKEDHVDQATSPPPILKVGGSILQDEVDYQRVTDRLRPWIARGGWVVVSAAGGVTDALEGVARISSQRAIADLLDRHTRLAGSRMPALESELTEAVRDRPVPVETIISWGERASATALHIRLRDRAISVPIVEMPIHGRPTGNGPALVPGFYLRDAEGVTRLLPRGGSDISAVLLAARLGASEVRLWKREGGIRSHTDDDGIVPELDGADLLRWLGSRVRPVSPTAVRLALQWGINLTLEDPFDRHPSTRVLMRPPAPPTPLPARAALETESRSPLWLGAPPS